MMVGCSSQRSGVFCVQCVWSLYNIKIMGKKLQKCHKNCNEHRFFMQQKHQSSLSCLSIEVSYCPVSSSSPTWPSFNLDHKAYTPAFCLGQDKAKYQINEQVYRRELDKFCKDQLYGKSEILVPKPKSLLPYCHVCKCNYIDYLQHTMLQRHKGFVRGNKFTTYIAELAKTYGTTTEETDQGILKDTCLDVAIKMDDDCSCSKEIGSTLTIGSSQNIQEQGANHGFTFVAAHGAMQHHQTRKIQQFRNSMHVSKGGPSLEQILPVPVSIVVIPVAAFQ